MARDPARAARGELQVEQAAPGKLLTSDDVARLLSVPTCTLQGWRHRRLGPPFVKLGTLVRYRIADLERWVAENRINTDAA